MASIAVPTFGVGDRPIAALRVSSPTLRFEPDPWVEPLFQTAEALSALMQSMAIGSRHLAVLPG